MILKKGDYTLSFSAHGISVIATDIHVDVYKNLKALFIIDNGLFKQYFDNQTLNDALHHGLRFYSDKKLFSRYQKGLDVHCKYFTDFFISNIHDKKKLSQKDIITFFEYTTKLCKDYTLMNVEHTDLAFAKRKGSSILEDNLSKASKYKDVIRKYMNKVLFGDNGYINETFKILGSQFDIEPSTILNLTRSELFQLFDGARPNDQDVLCRQQSFVVNFDRTILLQGAKAVRVLEEFRSSDSNTTSVSGKTAKLGKVRGKVKVINVDYTDMKLLNREISKMNHGDILVAKTTAPELIIACKKAAAIVTDIGGLLSHAAIVSREMGKPCIVGTEFATQVFKDGDVVEVDANMGTVRKI